MSVRKMRGYSTVWLLVLALAAVLFCGGCGFSKTESSAANDIWGQADATETDMISKIPGYIEAMYVKEGETVKKGQVLAKVDTRQLAAKKAEMEAQVAAARAKAMQARASMELAASDRQRMADLYKADAVSRQLYDSAVTKYDVAAESYTQALAGVKAYEQGVRQVEVNMEDTHIKAPMDGIIATKFVNVGALVSSGMPVYSIQDPTDNWVDFKVPETMLGNFRQGQQIRVQGRNMDLVLTGTITEISKKPDFATKRATSERGNATDIIAYKVRVQLDSPQVYPGMRFRMMDYQLDEGAR